MYLGKRSDSIGKFDHGHALHFPPATAAVLFPQTTCVSDRSAGRNAFRSRHLPHDSKLHAHTRKRLPCRSPSDGSSK